MGRDIPLEVKSAIFDMVYRADEIPNLQMAILFGSTIDGTFGKKSDIDVALFFETDHNPELGKELKIAQKIAGEICGKYNLPHSFAFVCINLKGIEQNEIDFLQTINQNGMIIWQKHNLLIGKSIRKHLIPYSLVIYSFKGLSPASRSRLYRFINGYKVRTTKKGKKYINEKPGILADEGISIGKGAFLIPQKRLSLIEETFRNIGAKYHIIQIYSEYLSAEKGQNG